MHKSTMFIGAFVACLLVGLVSGSANPDYRGSSNNNNNNQQANNYAAGSANTNQASSGQLYQQNANNCHGQDCNRAYPAPSQPNHHYGGPNHKVLPAVYGGKGMFQYKGYARVPAAPLTLRPVKALVLRHPGVQATHYRPQPVHHNQYPAAPIHQAPAYPMPYRAPNAYQQRPRRAHPRPVRHHQQQPQQYHHQRPHRYSPRPRGPARPHYGPARQHRPRHAPMQHKKPCHGKQHRAAPKRAPTSGGY